MENELAALGNSVDRLRELLAPLDDDAITARSYASEWTIADTMSHLGSGAVIMQRRVADAIAGAETPADFAQPIWDEWNDKTPREKVDDALQADAALVAQLGALSPAERELLTVNFGPVSVGPVAFVALRVNEHAFHSWDIEVVSDADTPLHPERANIVIDHLDLIGRFTARPTGVTGTITVRTTDPERDFTITLTPDSAALTAGLDGEPTLVMPAEAFARLVYGRLDADHTPAVAGDAAALDTLRAVFPGP